MTQHVTSASSITALRNVYSITSSAIESTADLPLSFSSTSVVIAPLLISVQTVPVEYRGIRYTVRVRIEREHWSVAIYPNGVEMPGKVITGPREKAESHAHSLINKWLEKHGRKNTKVLSKIQ
jgi:hypothetical protein